MDARVKPGHDDHHAALDARAPNFDSSPSTSPAGLAARKPWTSLQPSARSQSSWSTVSTPSAVDAPFAKAQAFARALVMADASVRGRSGKDESNGGTCTRLAFKPELSPQPIHNDAMDDMETKTTRAIMPARGEEWIERPPLDIGSHATAIVDEQNLYMLVVRRANRDVDSPLATAGEGMRHGIDGEIGQGLTEWPGVALHSKIWFTSEAERNVALLQLPLELRENLACQFACVEASPMRLGLIDRDLLERLNAVGGPAEI